VNKKGREEIEKRKKCRDSGRRKKIPMGVRKKKEERDPHRPI